MGPRAEKQIDSRWHINSRRQIARWNRRLVVPSHKASQACQPTLRPGVTPTQALYHVVHVMTSVCPKESHESQNERCPLLVLRKRSNVAANFSLQVKFLW